MASSTRRRFGGTITLIAVVLCAAAAAFAVVRGAAVPERASAAPAARLGSISEILVTRAGSGHDALWLLPPAGGSATAAGTLPGLAGEVAVSPDGQNVAYLPRNGAPHVWIGYGPLAPRNISLTAAGVTKVDHLTWIAGDKLLVSGVKTGTWADPLKDRLFTVNVTTGSVNPFRDLRGTEPSAAPGSGRVVYTLLTKLDSGNAANYHAPLIRESLRTVSTAGTGTGTTVTSEKYRRFAEQRAFFEPTLSPVAGSILSGATGSDVSVTYTVCDTSIGFPFLSIRFPAIPAQAGWDAGGWRTAFAGTARPLVQNDACAWVYDAQTGALSRTAAGLMPDVMIDQMAWSAGGDLVAGAVGWNGTSAVRHVYAIPGDLTSVLDLGPGRLPVYVRL